MNNKVLIILCGLLCGISGQCLAQPNNPHSLPSWQPDTAFIHSTNGNVYGFYQYVYNELAQRTEEHYFATSAGKWEEQIRRSHSYDSQGNKQETTEQAYENGQWKNRLKTQWAHDPQHRLTMESYQEWDDSLNRWHMKNTFYYHYNSQGLLDTFFRIENDSSYLARIFYRYDAHGNRTLEQWQYWDTAWTDMFRATSIYNQNDQIVDYLEENWNHTHGGPPKLIWENWLHYVYTYDSIGNNTELQTWLWLCEEEEWINEKHFFYSYDSLNLCQEELQLVWDRGYSKWVNKERISMEYDGDKRLLYSKKQTPYNNGWINNQASAYLYDEQDRMVSKSESYWNNQTQNWDNSIWYTWEYNPAGNLLENTFYNWDPQKQDWVGVYRYLNSVNEEGHGDTSRFEMYSERKGWYPFEQTLFVTYDNRYDSIGSFHTSKVSVHYRLIELDTTDTTDTNGVAIITNRSLRCYPNPVKEQLHVSTNDHQEILRCQLWDSQGRLVLEKQLRQSEVTLPMANLPKGIYLLRCQTEKGTWMETVTKQ